MKFITALSPLWFLALNLCMQRYCVAIILCRYDFLKNSPQAKWEHSRSYVYVWLSWLLHSPIILRERFRMIHKSIVQNRSTINGAWETQWSNRVRFVCFTLHSYISCWHFGFVMYGKQMFWILKIKLTKEMSKYSQTWARLFANWVGGWGVDLRKFSENLYQNVTFLPFWVLFGLF